MESDPRFFKRYSTSFCTRSVQSSKVLVIEFWEANIQWNDLKFGHKLEKSIQRVMHGVDLIDSLSFSDPNSRKSVRLETTQFCCVAPTLWYLHSKLITSGRFYSMHYTLNTILWKDFEQNIRTLNQCISKLNYKYLALLPETLVFMHLDFVNFSTPIDWIVLQNSICVTWVVSDSLKVICCCWISSLKVET